jgi:hypothetical protein
MNTSILKLSLLMFAWGVVASLAGHFQFLSHVPPRMAPLLIGGLTVLASFALRRVAWLRDAVATIGLRGLIATHVARFLGIVFLWYHAQGRLPEAFAMRAGWGDIGVATGAVALLLWPAGRSFDRAVFVWNILGALDLFVAVGTAGWLNLMQPGAMREIAQFPLTLVPLWLVPVMLSTHLLMLTGGVRRVEPAGSARIDSTRRAIVT